MNDATDLTVSRILVIDDNQAIHQDFRKIFGASRERSTPSVAELALFGGADSTDVPEFQIDSAYQGEEGLALVRMAQAQQSPYAMAFVDVRMPPGWDGIETTARIWQHDSDIQIVICTAYSDYTWSEMLAKLGRSDRLVILKKPFDTIEVVQLASALTEKWRLVRQSRSMLQNLERRVAERTRELAQAGERLKASEAQYRLLFDSNPHPMWVYDMETLRFVTVNGAAVEHYGYTEQQFLAMTIHHIRPAEDVAMLAKNVDELKGQGKSFGVWRHSKRDGSTIDVEISSDRIVFKGRPARLVLAHDVTERRRIEEEIHETKNFLASIFDNIPNSIFVKDARDLRFVRVNAACEKLTGYAEKEFVEKSDYDFFPKDQADFFVAKDRETLAGKQAVFTVDETITSKDGTQKILRTKKFPIVDKNGHPQYLLGMSEDITEQKKSERLLRESEASYRHLIEQSADGICLSDTQGHFVLVNSCACELLGYTVDELLGTNGNLTYPEEDRAIHAQHMQAVGTGKSLRFERMVKRKDGNTFPAEISLKMLDNGMVQEIFHDITYRRSQEQKISRLSRIHAVLSGINSAIVRIRDRRELFQESCRIAVDQGRFSMAWIGLVDRDALKIKPIAWAGDERGFLAVVEPRLSLSESCSPRGITAMAVADKRPVVVNDAANDSRVASLKKEHRERAIGSLAVLPLLVSGEAVGVLALHAELPGFFDDEEMKLLIELASDIAFSMDHIEKEEKLNYLAYYDVLTGLANRSLLQDRLDQALRVAERYQIEVAVLVIDLDRFKLLNDVLGHAEGDELLKLAASRIRACVRDVDTVARLGSDEFAVVLGGAQQNADGAQQNADGALRVSQQILQAFAEPVVVGGRELFVTCSIGAALYPQDGGKAEALFKNADAAMYRAKEQGRNNCQFYTPEASARADERLSLEAALRHALEREEFRLHYQPQLDLGTGQVIGLEALIRWERPGFGTVSPARFIPIAEEAGLILPIGEWVLRTASLQSKAWQDQGLPPIRIGVNLSAQQFRQANLARQIQKMLADTGLDPKYLEVELTESTLMHNVEAAIEIMTELRRAGVQISLDDFGTGYSSLSYLKRFPIDTLKIDQSFVREITTDPDSAAIAEAIIAMAHSLRLRVLAEGVETEGQLALLRARGCDQMQGYLFSKPLPAAEIAQLLRERRRLPVPAPAGEGYTLLLVDDEPHVLAALRRVLRSEGYRVLTADSPKTAFEVLAQNPIQVIVSDQRMPEMDGTEFLGRVKDLYPETVRIMLSGYSEIRSVTEAINRGAVYKFLHKPWDDEKLLATIKEAFQRCSDQKQ